MRRNLGIFLSVLLALATVVGLYLAAASLKLLWSFWLVIAASAFITLVFALRTPVKGVITAWRDYPAQLRRVAALQARVVELRSQRDAACASVKAAADGGIAEGHAQARGAIIAAVSGIPVVVGIAERERAVNLVAEIPVPAARVGGRYRVVLRLTGQLRGIVQVSEIDAARNICYLTCVEATNEEFWMALSKQVVTDDQAPSGIVLEPFVLGEFRSTTSIEEIVQEPTQQEEHA